MTEFKDRREVLEQKIRDMETALARLKSELKVEAERDQHEAIDHLEQYMSEVDNSNANLQEFFRVLKEEIAKLFGASSGKTGTPT